METVRQFLNPLLETLGNYLPSAFGANDDCGLIVEPAELDDRSAIPSALNISADEGLLLCPGG